MTKTIRTNTAALALTIGLELAADQGEGTDTLMIDAPHLETHRTATSLGLKKGCVVA